MTDLYFRVDRRDIRVLFYEFNLTNPALYGVAISLAFVLAFIFEYLCFLQSCIDVRHSTACRSILSSGRSKRNKLMGRIGVMLGRRIVGFLTLIMLLTMEVGVVMGAVTGGMLGYGLFTWWGESRGEKRGRVANKPADLTDDSIYKKYEERAEEVNVQKYPISTREYPADLPAPLQKRQDSRDLEY